MGVNMYNLLKNVMKSLPFQLAFSIGLAFAASDFFSFDNVRFFFTISCFIKELLMAVLPFVVFSYITAAILDLEQRAPLLILSLLVLVLCSNALTVLISYGTSMTFLPWITTTGSDTVTGLIETISPLYILKIPQILSPDRTMLLGLSFGILFSFIKVPKVSAFISRMREFVNIALKRGFIPLLPLYVFGFVLKMAHEGSLEILMKNYGQVFLLTCALIIAFLCAQYLIAAEFNPKRFLSLLREMIPAGITAFSTMSSAATMPVTLAATEKNLGDPQFTQLVIPTTVNIHLLGDALSVPLIGIAMLMIAGFPLPTFESYLIFTFYFCLAKFSSAGIPGGGVIVLLPVLQSHLGLTPEMTSLVATLYILQDPIITATNVMANGAFALISHKICGKIRLVQSPKLQEGEST